MRAFVLALLAMATVASPAGAEVTTAAKVRYDVSYGQSDWYDMRVTFLLGSELNRATKSFNYSAWDKYALLFFGEGEVAIIKLENIFVSCNQEFSVSCLPSFGNLTGEDQSGKKWEICTRRYC
ncbi:hypothetical protein [Asticcacaulis excentricus]|uniref:hypothetical protein n=1 Tax=Asticcacaulis excentricus TaxID=78587 RepID=UPI000F8170CF|nr:hypothetical protein [Asticcacaulis excentricus]